jgi:transposase-like protein
MAYSDLEKARLKAEVESGKMTIRKISQKWGMSLNTLKKFIKAEEWTYAKNDTELTKKVEASVLQKIIDSSTDILKEVTDDYLKSSKEMKALSRFIIQDFVKKAKKVDEDGNSVLTKTQSEAALMAQRVVKEASSTMSLLFNDTRKALGLDKEKEGTTNNIQINNDSTPTKVEIIGIDPDGPPPE